MTSSEIKIVPKGWGYEKWIVNTDEYCGKLLHFIKGKKCSWHYHILKDETFYLQEGKLLVKYSDKDNLDDKLYFDQRCSQSVVNHNLYTLLYLQETFELNFQQKYL